MKLYIVASLFLAVATTVFAQCNGGNVTCPDGKTLIDEGASATWSCCDQNKNCLGNPGVSFDRWQERYHYYEGSATHHCVSGDYHDDYPTPQSCCSGL